MEINELPQNIFGTVQCIDKLILKVNIVTRKVYLEGRKVNA